MAKDSNQLATFWMRLLAHNIDLLILLIPLFIAGIYIESNRMLYTAGILLYVVYHVAFELSKWQASPGKRILSLKVRNSFFESPGFLAIFLRTTLKFLSLMLLFGGFAMISFTKKKQGLHDLIAGTVITVDK